MRCVEGEQARDQDVKNLNCTRFYGLTRAEVEDAEVDWKSSS